MVLSFGGPELHPSRDDDNKLPTYTGTAMKAPALLVLLSFAACKSDSGKDTGTDTGSDTGSPVDPNAVTMCENDLGEVESGVCDVSAGSNGALLLRGTLLVPDDILQDGEILIDASGDIACAACDCSNESEYANATVVTCPMASSLLDSSTLTITLATPKAHPLTTAPPATTTATTGEAASPPLKTTAA